MATPAQTAAAQKALQAKQAAEAAAQAEALALLAANTPAPTQGKALEYAQVLRILRSRKLIKANYAGQMIESGLRIVGRGNATKSLDNPRVVYNTNAMRDTAMVEAAAHLRNAQVAESIGDIDGAQAAYRSALNAGVISFSLPADWNQLSPDALITAKVDSFTIKTGADAGKTGVGFTDVRVLPGIKLENDANAWDLLMAGDGTGIDAANAI